MSIETTMYIHDTTMSLLNDACVLTGRKRNEMIVLLLNYAMADLKRAVKTGCRVRYQGRDCREKWHTVHVRFREDEADYAKDLRNFLKLSDSLILALAAREYLNEIVRKSRKDDGNDNYRFSNYFVSREVIGGSIQWRINWGYPPKTGKYKGI
jgi:hypothetical protein